MPFRSTCFCSQHHDPSEQCFLSLVYVEYTYRGFPLEHRFLRLVHVLTVAHVLTPVNVHHHRYDAHPTATLVPTLIWFKCIHVNHICTYCCIRVNTVRYMVVNFCGDQIFIDFVRFLIHEVLYAWCLKGIIFTVPGFYQLVLVHLF